MDLDIIKIVTELGSTGLAAGLMFLALRYTISASSLRATEDREAFTAAIENLRKSHETLCREERAQHEKEIETVTGEFRVAVERLGSTTRELATAVEVMRRPPH
jgi:hypothetical protein